MIEWTFADRRAYAAKKLDNLRTSRSIFETDEAVKQLSQIMPPQEAKAKLKPLLDHRAEDVELLDNLSKELWSMTEPTINTEAK